MEEDEQRKFILRKFLTKDALERLARIRIVKPELCIQLEAYLIQLYQQGKIKKVDDAQLKSILEVLSSQKRFKILK